MYFEVRAWWQQPSEGDKWWLKGMVVWRRHNPPQRCSEKATACSQACLLLTWVSWRVSITAITIALYFTSPWLVSPVLSSQQCESVKGANLIATSLTSNTLLDMQLSAISVHLIPPTQGLSHKHCLCSTVSFHLQKPRNFSKREFVLPELDLLMLKKSDKYLFPSNCTLSDVLCPCNDTR